MVFHFSHAFFVCKLIIKHLFVKPANIKTEYHTFLANLKVVLLKISNYYFQEYSIGDFLYFKSNILDITYIIIYFL
ncbi:hypothetical protein HMPREF0381_2752 [Lachnoanaerobaculum saburreum DSM 3986]|uniref:Uncharacterized protein n=1 Tax=Lachnoanaerobaculum saburreum DSM 3986 TaxID=887325 RepID=E6LS17_9FIRM|nr:hypothetical protein HMPREF0381_2752 [Lachnoanaerobaculum saburreum DSM 3986]